MAKRAKKIKNGNNVDVTHDTPPFTNGLLRLARVIAVMAIRGLPQKDQVSHLRSMGFAIQEVAEIVGTTTNQVSVILYQIRRDRTEKAKRSS